jgi:type IV pilus assembly protein PilC
MILNTIKSGEKVNFTKNLAVMLRGGITINEALASLSEQTKSKRFKDIITKIRKEIETGTSLGEAFSKEGAVFGPVFVSLIQAGEASGTLEENLSFLADWLERDYDLRQEIKAATLYPKFVLGATVLLGGGLAIYILPNLVNLFEQLRVDLPLATRMLLGASVFVQEFWHLTILGLIGLYIAFKFINKIKLVKRFFHLLYLHFPLVKGLVVNYQLALVSQVFYTLLKSGLPISETLLITSGSATNIHYRESIQVMEARVLKGTKLSEAMEEYPDLYPPSMKSIVATGEKSGSLPSSFEYLSEFYSKEVKNRTKKLPTAIEPILLVLIALGIGFVAISIISPIYEITQGIRS